MKNLLFKHVLYGIFAAMLLLSLYFAIVSLISGRGFALSQFGRYWYYFGGLAVGFGIQIGLFSHLRSAMLNGGGKVVAISGAASGTAMLSCCAHYLANILPVIGVSGLVSAIGQFQIELFWVGLLFNVLGIAYIGNKAVKLNKFHVSE